MDLVVSPQEDKPAHTHATNSREKSSKQPMEEHSNSIACKIVNSIAFKIDSNIDPLPPPPPPPPPPHTLLATTQLRALVVPSCRSLAGLHFIDTNPVIPWVLAMVRMTLGMDTLVSRSPL